MTVESVAAQAAPAAALDAADIAESWRIDPANLQICQRGDGPHILGQGAFGQVTITVSQHCLTCYQALLSQLYGKAFVSRAYLSTEVCPPQ